MCSLRVYDADNMETITVNDFAPIDSPTDPVLVMYTKDQNSYVYRPAATGLLRETMETGGSFTLIARGYHNMTGSYIEMVILNTCT